MILQFVLKEERFNRIYFHSIKQPDLEKALNHYGDLLDSNRLKDAIEEIELAKANQPLQASMAYLAFEKGKYKQVQVWKPQPNERDRWIDQVNEFWSSQRGNKISYVNLRDSFSSISPTGRPGAFTHFDEVHPSAEGQYLIATTVYHRLRASVLPHLPERIPSFDEFIKEYRSKLDADRILKTLLREDAIRAYPLQVKKYDRALGEIDPRFALILASLYTRLGDKDFARRELHRAEKLLHENQSAIALVGELESLAAGPTAATRALRELLAADLRTQ